MSHEPLECWDESSHFDPDQARAFLERIGISHVTIDPDLPPARVEIRPIEDTPADQEWRCIMDESRELRNQSLRAWLAQTRTILAEHLEPRPWLTLTPETIAGARDRQAAEKNTLTTKAQNDGEPQLTPERFLALIQHSRLGGRPFPPEMPAPAYTLAMAQLRTRPFDEAEYLRLAGERFDQQNPPTAAKKMPAPSYPRTKK